MEKAEAKSAVKALYLQAAALAGYEVRPNSPERLAAIVDLAFGRVSKARRPEAVANTLRLLAATLEQAQKKRKTTLGEEDVQAGHDEVCPVYPFKAKRK